MKVSTRARYGLRGLYDIAYHNLGKPTHVKDIARRQGITPRYLEQIFQSLKKAGLVAAIRGPRGGYYLSRPPEEISIGDVVRATEGPIQFTDTGKEGSRSKGGAKDVPRTGSVRIVSDVWDEIAARIETHLDSISLAELCARGEEEGVPREADARRLMYFI